MRLTFDVDDDRNLQRVDSQGNLRVAFVGKPRHKLRSDRHTKMEQALIDLFENFDQLLNVPDLDKFLLMDFDLGANHHGQPIAPPRPITKHVFDRPRPTTLPPPPVLPLDPGPANSQARLTKEEEDLTLHHFFTKLLPMLDSTPNLPWPDLALRYCDFDIARLCFLALALVHMYELGEYPREFYHKGVAHINRAMRLLTNNILNRLNENSMKLQVLSFIILMLIHVHLLYSCLETGRSALARYLFQVFAAVGEEVLMEESDARMVTMMAYVLVYDTICALVTPDARAPFCMTAWYGNVLSEISTYTLMGCPGEIMSCFHKIGHLRGMAKRGEDVAAEIPPLRLALMVYREYVPCHPEYAALVRAAQCWALAGLVSLTRLSANQSAEKYIWEFIDNFAIFNGDQLLVQMVWPIHIMAVSANHPTQRAKMMEFLEFQMELTQMRMYSIMKEVVEKVWATGQDPDEALALVLPPGADYLCI